MGVKTDMPFLLKIHLVIMYLWAGLVLGEVIIELLQMSRPILRSAAVTMHLWIDLLFELPLVTGALITGILLLEGRTWNIWLGIKAGAGLGAILSNYACIVMVIWRAMSQYRKRGPRRIVQLNRAIFASAVIGFPLAAVSAVLGFIRG